MALQAHLENYAVVSDLFNGGVLVTRLDGVAIADVPRTAGRLGVSYLDQDAVAIPLREGRDVIGKPTMGKKLLAPVFSITVPAGKQLTAVVIPNGWDAALVLLDGLACGMSATCFESSDSSISGAETARFTNSGTTDRTVFIVVDSYSASASGTFDLFTALTP